MKQFKKVLAFVLALAMVVTAVPTADAKAAAKAPKINNYKKILYVGQYYTLKVNNLPANWKKCTYAWSTSDKSVATIKKGKYGQAANVTAVKAGKATVTVKMTYPQTAAQKKAKKKTVKTFKCAVTVKDPSIIALEAAEVIEGSTVSVKATAVPANAKITYESDNTNVATVDADGIVTGVKAGTAIITSTALNKTAKTVITVKSAAAQLATVKQTASNEFVANFTADASKTITKDDFRVVAADNSAELPVKSVAYSADGLSATVTLLNNFVDATAYKISCKDVTLDFTATVGAVDHIAITTSSAEQNVATPIKFALYDKNNIDITSSVSIDTTCFVNVNGNYSTAEINKASTAKITMANVGDTVDVTVTYSSNAKDAQDVTATQKITCVAAKAVKGEAAFLKTTTTNAISNCAKFYLGTSDKSVSVVEGAAASDVYFCAKQDEYTAYSYDSYEVESANDTIASASVDIDNGKFAKISVQGNTVGSTQLNVKAVKNDVATYYTIPVTVTKPLKAVKMTVDNSRPIMSNVNDSDYAGTITAKLYDAEGNEVTGNGTFQFEITTKSGETDTPIEKHDGASTTKITAAAATAKTYTIKVTGSDTVNGNGEVFMKSTTVQVKSLPADATDPAGKGVALTYQIEMNATSLDEAVSTKRTLTPNLYATCNGLFAGYVRIDGGDVTVAEGNVKANAATALEDVKVAAKFGTKILTATNELYGATGTHEQIADYNATSFDTVNTAGTIEYTPEGSTTLAKEGNYTLEYKLYYTKDKDNGAVPENKAISKTNAFTVTNSIVKPKVAVVSKTVDSLTDADIFKDGIKTNVDMNNNQVETNSSFVKLMKNLNDLADIEATSTGSKMIVKYAVVEDNYGGETWNFFIPINTTFKTE